MVVITIDSMWEGFNGSVRHAATYQIGGDVDGGFEESAGVAAQVEDESGEIMWRGISIR